MEINFFKNEFVEFLKSSFIEERNIQYKKGIYGFTQKRLAYNSNKIEGSTLTPEHTTALFEDKFEYMPDQDYRRKDVEEMTGHFIAFNYILDELESELSENIIKHLHYELKAGVFSDRMNGYAVGDYKKRPNKVGDYNTTLPKDVTHEMNKLLEWYNKSDITLEILAEFHARYETIHPFQDGNGRTGRLLLFKESMRNNINPIIIYDDMRSAYINSLKIFRDTGSVQKLIVIFEECQSRYKDECEYFRQIIN